MKLVLINPNDLNPFDTHRSDFRETFLGYVGPAMSFPHLLSQFRDEDWEVEIVDYFARYLAAEGDDPDEEMDLDPLAEKALEGADAVGIYCMTSTQKYSLHFAEMARRIRPSAKVIFGGPHTIIDSAHLSTRPDIDYIVVGRGDTVLPGLVQHIQEGGSTERKIWQDSNTSLANAAVGQYDFYFERDRRGEMKTASIFTSKGCVESCKFCSRNNLKKVIAYKPIEVLVKELRYLERNGIERIRIDDDNFAQDPDFSVGLFDTMRDEKLNFDLSIITRADTITDRLMDIYTAVGGKSVIMAVETGSERLREEMGKNLTDAQVYATAERLKKWGVRIYLFLMLGYPGETHEDLKKTEEMADRIQPDGVSVSIFHTHPGMPIYKKIAKEMNIADDYWRRDGRLLQYVSGEELEVRHRVQRALEAKFGFSITGFWHESSEEIFTTDATTMQPEALALELAGESGAGSTARPA